ncbi:MAG: hypothetical protein WCS37_03735 [Chloroflexota bacterium]|nr:hypothetical protein [Chloroflexota bacterium]
MNDYISERLELLLERLRTTYDGIGHSSGRPYVYFIYEPGREREVRRRVGERFQSDEDLSFHYVDFLNITMKAIAGQEDRRRELLNDPSKAGSSAQAIVRLWAKKLSQEINERLVSPATAGRPVMILQGLAALHPLGNPTSLMEALAEQEPRDPKTGLVVPIVLLVPGSRPPQSSRRYLFLDLENLRLDFYRGEEI